MHPQKLLFFFISFTMLLSALSAQDNLNQQQQAIQNPEVGFTEHTGDFLPEDAMLINENDSLVALGDLIDKPTVLTFVYYDCPGICTPLLNELADLVDQMNLKLGEDYQIITVSFDPSEPTRLARQKKKNIMSTIKKQEQAKKGWKFFTADSAQVNKLTDAAGFHYKPQGTEYVHSGGFIAVSPEGKITRYFKGISFLPFELKMSMIEASKGEVGPPVNKMLQYCFAYDPEGQTYVADITKISGIVIIFFAVLMLIVLIIRSRVKRRKTVTQ
jgi:protein SCO1/2